MMEAPKSRSAGSEIVGTEEVNLEGLMIPMDGADAKMREAMSAYTNASRSSMGKPAQSVQPDPPLGPEGVVLLPIPPTDQPAPVKNVSPNEAVLLLREINDKLDLIIKRAKIQPRYKKPKAKKPKAKA